MKGFLWFLFCLVFVFSKLASANKVWVENYFDAVSQIQYCNFFEIESDALFKRNLLDLKTRFINNKNASDAISNFKKFLGSKIGKQDSEEFINNKELMVSSFSKVIENQSKKSKQRVQKMIHEFNQEIDFNSIDENNVLLCLDNLLLPVVKLHEELKKCSHDLYSLCEFKKNYLSTDTCLKNFEKIDFEIKKRRPIPSTFLKSINKIRKFIGKAVIDTRFLRLHYVTEFIDYRLISTSHFQSYASKQYSIDAMLSFYEHLMYDNQTSVSTKNLEVVYSYLKDIAKYASESPNCLSKKTLEGKEKMIFHCGPPKSHTICVIDLKNPSCEDDDDDKKFNVTFYNLGYDASQLHAMSHGYKSLFSPAIVFHAREKDLNLTWFNTIRLIKQNEKLSLYHVYAMLSKDFVVCRQQPSPTLKFHEKMAKSIFFLHHIVLQQLIGEEQYSMIHSIVSTHLLKTFVLTLSGNFFGQLETSELYMGCRVIGSSKSDPQLKFQNFYEDTGNKYRPISNEKPFLLKVENAFKVKSDLHFNFTSTEPEKLCFYNRWNYQLVRNLIIAVYNKPLRLLAGRKTLTMAFSDQKDTLLSLLQFVEGAMAFRAAYPRWTSEPMGAFSKNGKNYVSDLERVDARNLKSFICDFSGVVYAFCSKNQVEDNAIYPPYPIFKGQEMKYLDSIVVFLDAEAKFSSIFKSFLLPKICFLKAIADSLIEKIDWNNFKKCQYQWSIVAEKLMQSALSCPFAGDTKFVCGTFLTKIACFSVIQRVLRENAKYYASIYFDFENCISNSTEYVINFTLKECIDVLDKWFDFIANLLISEKNFSDVNGSDFSHFIIDKCSKSSSAPNFSTDEISILFQAIFHGAPISFVQMKCTFVDDDGLLQVTSEDIKTVFKCSDDYSEMLLLCLRATLATEIRKDGTFAILFPNFHYDLIGYGKKISEKKVSIHRLEQNLTIKLDPLTFTNDKCGLLPVKNEKEIKFSEYLKSPTENGIVLNSLKILRQAATKCNFLLPEHFPNASPFIYASIMRENPNFLTTPIGINNFYQIFCKKDAPFQKNPDNYLPILQFFDDYLSKCHQKFQNINSNDDLSEIMNAKVLLSRIMNHPRQNLLPSLTLELPVGIEYATYKSFFKLHRFAVENFENHNDQNINEASSIRQYLKDVLDDVDKLGIFIENEVYFALSVSIYFVEKYFESKHTDPNLNENVKNAFEIIRYLPNSINNGLSSKWDILEGIKDKFCNGSVENRFYTYNSQIYKSLAFGDSELCFYKDHCFVKVNSRFQGILINSSDLVFRSRYWNYDLKNKMIGIQKDLYWIKCIENFESRSQNPLHIAVDMISTSALSGSKYMLISKDGDCVAIFDGNNMKMKILNERFNCEYFYIGAVQMFMETSTRYNPKVNLSHLENISHQLNYTTKYFRSGHHKNESVDDYFLRKGYLLNFSCSTEVYNFDDGKQRYFFFAKFKDNWNDFFVSLVDGETFVAFRNETYAINHKYMANNLLANYRLPAIVANIINSNDKLFVFMPWPLGIVFDNTSTYRAEIFPYPENNNFSTLAPKYKILLITWLVVYKIFDVALDLMVTIGTSSEIFESDVIKLLEILEAYEQNDCETYVFRLWAAKIVLSHSLASLADQKKNQNVRNLASKLYSEVDLIPQVYFQKVPFMLSFLEEREEHVLAEYLGSIQNIPSFKSISDFCNAVGWFRDPKNFEEFRSAYSSDQFYTSWIDNFQKLWKAKNPKNNDGEILKYRMTFFILYEKTKDNIKNADFQKNMNNVFKLLFLLTLCKEVFIEFSKKVLKNDLKNHENISILFKNMKSQTAIEFSDTLYAKFRSMQPKKSYQKGFSKISISLNNNDIDLNTFFDDLNKYLLPISKTNAPLDFFDFSRMFLAHGKIQWVTLLLADDEEMKRYFCLKNRNAALDLKKKLWHFFLTEMYNKELANHENFVAKSGNFEFSLENIVTSIIEYGSQKILKPDQRHSIEKMFTSLSQNKNPILQLPMGGGKTEMIGPALVFYSIYKLRKLPVFIVPSGLLAQGILKYSEKFCNSFKLQVVSISCSRSQNCNNAEYMKKILLTLGDAYKTKGIIITCLETIQCFENLWRESVMDCITLKDVEYKKKSNDIRIYLQNILLILRNHCFPIIDEFDSVICLTKTYNFSGKKNKPIPEEFATLTIKLFRKMKLKQCKIELDNKLDIDPFKSNTQLSENELKKFTTLLEEICVGELEKLKTDDTLKRYIIPCWKKERNIDYGMPTDDGIFVVPYDGPNQPKNRSNFQDPKFSTALTIKYYFEALFSEPPAGMTEILQKEICETFNLHYKKDTLWNQIKSSVLRTDSPNFEKFYLKFVNSKILDYQDQIVCTPFDALFFFERFAGYSGTIYNYKAYENFKKIELLRDYGNNAECMILKAFEDVKEADIIDCKNKAFLKKDLIDHIIEKKFSAVFDIAGLLKDEDNGKFANEILDLGKHDAVIYRHSKEGKFYVIVKDKEPVYFNGESIKDFMNSNKSVENPFVFLDGYSTVGVNILLQDNAACLSLVSSSTTLRELYQGVMRARGLTKGITVKNDQAIANNDVRQKMHFYVSSLLNEQVVMKKKDDLKNLIHCSLENIKQNGVVEILKSCAFNQLARNADEENLSSLYKYCAEVNFKIFEKILFSSENDIENLSKNSLTENALKKLFYGKQTNDKLISDADHCNDIKTEIEKDPYFAGISLLNFQQKNENFGGQQNVDGVVQVEHEQELEQQNKLQLETQLAGDLRNIEHFAPRDHINNGIKFENPVENGFYHIYESDDFRYTIAGDILHPAVQKIPFFVSYDSFKTGFVSITEAEYHLENVVPLHPIFCWHLSDFYGSRFSVDMAVVWNLACFSGSILSATAYFEKHVSPEAFANFVNVDSTKILKSNMELYKNENSVMKFKTYKVIGAA